MRYDSFFNNALDGFYRSIIAISAIVFSASSFAVGPPVHDIWSKPTGSTGANIGAGYTIHRNGVMSSSNPVKLPDGKIVSFADGKVTIKDASVSSKINASVRAGAGAMKRGAVRCLTSFKCNVATMAAGAGLEQLFDGLDWVMGEGGQIQKITVGYYEGSSSSYAPPSYDHSESFIRLTSPDSDYILLGQAYTPNGYDEMACKKTVFAQQKTQHFIGSSIWIDARYGWMANCFYSVTPPDEFIQPVSSPDIESGVNDFYNPNEKDWGVIGPWIPVADPDLELEITNLPRLTLPTRTRTIYDADGQAVEVEETNIWHDFDISANPSKNPQIKGKKTEEKKTFKDGVLTSTSTTTSSSSPDTNAPATPEAEQLTDCLFFPTLCEWLDWTREEPVEPTDDLSGLLKEVSVSNRSYTITGGAAACPAPLSLNLAQFGNKEVSYQPLCDLASTMRPLYLALMAFLSALLIHRSINRV